MKVFTASRSLETFFDSFEKPDRAEIFQMLDILITRGHLLRMPYSRKILPGIFELRISCSVQIRVFYAYRNGGAVLLHAVVKKGRRLPRHAIDLAIANLKQFDAI